VELKGTWENYLWQRLAYYSELVRKAPYKLMYLRGWMNRTVELRKLVGER
jgi:hypothetical protein